MNEYSFDFFLWVSKRETSRFRKKGRKVNGTNNWDNTLFSGWRKMKTGVASKQMNLMFIKQVCLGTEDEEVYGRAIPSLGMSWMPRTRETCKEKKI